MSSKLALVIAFAVLRGAFAASSALAYGTQTYVWGRVPIGGGGAIPIIVVHPKVKDVVYIGADVGAVDRWDAVHQRWIPTMDHKGDLQGCDALAVDPSDTTGNVVWAAMGSDRSTGVILKSANRGKTWVNKSKTQFPCNANGDQGVNERLAVDPVNSRVLYFATRNGLWQTVDDGVSWHKLPGAPLGDQTDIGKDGPCGDRMIVLDPTSGVTGNPVRTKRIYLAPYFAGTGPGAALYESQDGGVSWSAMPGSPSNIENAAIDPDGVLYCTNSAGAYRYSGGSVGSWTDITPKVASDGRYIGIDIDPFDPHNIVMARSAYVCVSHDRGATWPFIAAEGSNQTTMPVDPGWYYDNAVPQHNSHFGWGMFALKFDPFHRGAVWQTDSFLAWHTSNIYASNVGWQTRIAGHEETVGSMIVSPPSGPAILYSGAADVYGFRHTSLTSWPTTLRICLNGWINNPLELTGGDFEEDDPNFAAFVGVQGWSGPGGGGYTTDGGAAYTSFGTVPEIDKGQTATYGGRICVSANSRTMVWMCGNSGNVYYSIDLGKTWDKSSFVSPGALVAGQIFDWRTPICADRRNGAAFYIFDWINGRFYRSSDWGRTFALVASGLPKGQFWWGGKVFLFASPAAAGDLWLSIDGAAGGLLHSTDSGASWTRLVNVQNARLAGIGKGLTDRTPSLFVMGIVDGAASEGIFRSDDTGRSWIKIDIDRPYPNNASFLCGDRRSHGLVYIDSSTGIYYGKPL